MFVSDRIVFLELQKTGCTHIRNLLKELVGGELVGKHNQAGPDLFSGNLFFLGSVRNPWDWYTSLWAFGCDHRGAVFGNVTRQGIKVKGRGWRTNPYSAFRELLESRPNRNSEKWRRTYEDVSDASAFREWLHMMHDETYWPDVGEGYRQCPLNRFAGLLTYRYMKFFTCKKGEIDALKAVSTPEQLAEHERKNGFIDYFIRNERLESDLLDALKLVQTEVPHDASAKLMSRPRTNTSSKKHGPRYYYDAEAEKLVDDRDRFIVDKFGYLAPSARD